MSVTIPPAHTLTTDELVTLMDWLPPRHPALAVCVLIISGRIGKHTADALDMAESFDPDELAAVQRVMITGGEL